MGSLVIEGMGHRVIRLLGHCEIKTLGYNKSGETRRLVFKLCHETGTVMKKERMFDSLLIEPIVQVSDTTMMTRITDVRSQNLFNDC